jgi:hypothetical protein
VIFQYKIESKNDELERAVPTTSNQMANWRVVIDNQLFTVDQNETFTGTSAGTSFTLLGMGKGVNVTFTDANHNTSGSYVSPGNVYDLGGHKVMVIKSQF